LGIILFVVALISGAIGVVWGAPGGVDISTEITHLTLKELGFYSGRVDAEKGPATVAAIQRWQDDAGFPVTGELTGPQALALLRQAAERGLEPARAVLELLAAKNVSDADSPRMKRAQEHVVPVAKAASDGQDAGGPAQEQGDFAAGGASDGQFQTLAASVRNSSLALEKLEQEHRVLAALVEDRDQLLDDLGRMQLAISAGVEENENAILELGSKLDDTIDRTASSSQRVDSMAARLSQISDAVASQRDHIEDNSVRLFETLIGVDAVKAEPERIREIQRLHKEAVADNQATLEALSEGNAQLRLLFIVALCVLVPLAMIIFQTGPGGLDLAGDAPQAGADAALPASSGWVVTAWFGGGTGFFLVGAGIMFGGSVAGVVGAPTDFIAGLWASSLAQLDSATQGSFISHVLLAGIVAVTACSGSAERLSAGGHLLIALTVGILIYPLLGHWTNASAILAGQTGWLTDAGFVYASGTTGVALLGGVMALSLVSGQHRDDEDSPKAPAQSGSTRMQIAGAVILWVAWPGVILAAGIGDLELPDMLLAGAISLAAGAWSALALESMFSTQPRWHRVPGAALAGLVASPGVFSQATTAELVVLGILAGLSYLLLMRILSRRFANGIELAAMLAAGGFWGTMAPALLGADGFFSVGTVAVVLPQLLGLGVALVLAGAAGRALALATLRIDLLRVRQ
jgi:ammonia channel protein AmtB